MNTLQTLGMGIMGWAILPTPEDAILYPAGGAGAVKDVGLFMLGLATFAVGSMKKGGRRK